MNTTAYLTFSSPVTLRLQSTPHARPRVVTPETSETLDAQVIEREFTELAVYPHYLPRDRRICAYLPPIPRMLEIYGPEDFSAAAADSAEQHVERIRQILGDDPAAVLQALIDGSELPPRPPRIPRVIANWRAKAVLRMAGLADQIEAAIEQLPEPGKTVVSTAWHGNADIARRGPTVESLATALGLTDEQLDAMFIQAEALQV